MSLKDAGFATRLPAQDLERARRFYADKLGLEPVEERPGGLLYRCGGAEFALYESTGASPGTFTQGGFSVEDLDATMADLKARGLVFADEFGISTSRATTRARAGAASARCGSATPRATCSASANRSDHWSTGPTPLR